MPDRDPKAADLHTLRNLQRDLEDAGKSKGYYHMPPDTARKAGEALGRHLEGVESGSGDIAGLESLEGKEVEVMVGTAVRVAASVALTHAMRRFW